MATIGLDKLYYATITENEHGEETYATPKPLAKAISAELSIEVAEAILYADDGASEVVKEFKNGTLSLGIDELGSAVAAELTGATVDGNGVLVSASEDGGKPVAIGFRAAKANGKYTRRDKVEANGRHPWKAEATEGDTGLGAKVISDWYKTVYEPKQGTIPGIGG